MNMCPVVLCGCHVPTRTHKAGWELRRKEGLDEGECFWREQTEEGQCLSPSSKRLGGTELEGVHVSLSQ